MVKSSKNKGKSKCSLSDTATRVSINPGDYELGSMQSRAAARSLAAAKKRPARTIQIILVSPDGKQSNGPLIEIPPR